MAKPLPAVPIELSAKRRMRTQFGALCYRYKKDKLQVLLVSGRNGKRWGIPKGWPVSGQTMAQSAAQEAWEEAGVTGVAKNTCIGLYHYVKRLQTDGLPGETLPCVVAVFPLRVTALADVYPEHETRKRRWLSVKKAAKRVKAPELQAMLLAFAPQPAKAASVLDR